VSPEAVHADLVALIPDLSPDRLTEICERAAELGALEGVQTVTVIEAEGGGDFDIGFFFVLEDAAYLEAFGTDPRYTRFLQGGVAPVLRGLAGADIQLFEPFPEVLTHAACLALIAPTATYDWEVRNHLQSWQKGLGAATSTAGLAIGAQGRYRGLGIAFADEPLHSTGIESAKLAVDALSGRARRLA
jgi:hypothetical protein